MGRFVVIGSSGALGNAFVMHWSQHYPDHTIYAFSRKKIEVDRENVQAHVLDWEDELSLAQAATLASNGEGIDRVVVATGVLHGAGFTPEKSYRALDRENCHRLFHVNGVLPALCLKHFLPQLAKDRPSLFAALSARVGSISDNRLGGWYAYRVSKAALNMMLKNATIEMARTHPLAVIVGLHPGTVDSALSKPFQRYVAEGKLFSPRQSVEKLDQVLNRLTPQDSGHLWAWDGQRIDP